MLISIFALLVSVDAAPLESAFKPDEITVACERIEKVNETKLSEIVAVPNDKRTFQNTVLAIENASTDYYDAVSRITFMKEVHEDPAVRAAAAKCEERSGKYLVNVGARKDLYLAMKAYLDDAGKTDTLDPQDKRLIDVTMRDFKKNGLELSDKDRDKLIGLRSRLTTLQTKYSHNLDESKLQLEVTKEELDGLPEAFIARLKPAKNPKKLVVTTQYPDYFPVMENAKKEAIRKKMQIAFMSRGAKENTKLLEEAVKIRSEAARLLGYTTHVDFVTADRMAKSATNVEQFENRLREGLKPRLSAENEKLRALKAEETKQKNPKLFSWDWRYYLNQMKKKDYALDDEAIRQYFPADKVFAGMFEVYATLFGVKMAEVPGAKVWSKEGVKLYEVKDAKSNAPIAKFYVDLYPREGKYGHAACFPLGLARQTGEGYQIPMSVLVTNFNPPKDGKPAYLSVNEVTTLFHEFGHVMHASLTTAKYAALAGTNVSTDFVEAPSQMLENWVFRPEVLAKISVDPADATRAMPEDLAKRIIEARKFDAGIKYSRQVFLGTFDFKIHTGSGKVDTDKVAKQLWKEIMGTEQDRKERFSASFGHMMGGYDAGYYGYLWSEVFAADMFTRFEKEGVLNPSVGRAYRDTILAKGRSEEASALLEQFLGRAPNESAFLEGLGIQGAAKK
ncbi:MAG: Zn-dependent oligopeptidase [Deltaproteobacteria bacterium]|nr:Zn-dependent oligopeptidase [Deltaproteobacteria bacterium]